MKGSGADETIEKAAILYYTFEGDKLSGEELKNSMFAYAFSIKHNDGLNKAIYGKKFKEIWSEKSNLQQVSEIEKLRQNIANSLNNQ